jgi:hypothetical protein
MHTGSSSPAELVLLQPWHRTGGRLTLPSQCVSARMSCHPYTIYRRDVILHLLPG